MWGTEYVAAPPQQHQGNVSICNRYRVIGPLMLQIETKPLSAHTTDVSTPQPNRAVAEYPPTSSFQPASPGS